MFACVFVCVYVCPYPQPDFPEPHSRKQNIGRAALLAATNASLPTQCTGHPGVASQQVHFQWITKLWVNVCVYAVRGTGRRWGSLRAPCLGVNLTCPFLKGPLVFATAERRVPERACFKPNAGFGGIEGVRMQDKHSIDGNPLKATIVKGLGVRELRAKESC